MIIACLARDDHWYKRGMDILGVTNCFLIRFKTCPKRPDLSLERNVMGYSDENGVRVD